MAFGVELRTCQGCRKSSIVYQGGRYLLVKYGVRHYAHPVCLAKKAGAVAARAGIPEHQRASFDLELELADEWDRGLIDHADRLAKAKAAKAHALTIETKAGRPGSPIRSRFTCSCGAACTWTTPARANKAGDEHVAIMGARS